MADIPAGYVALDLVGFTDRGPYVAGATYMINDLVHVNNAIWRCKVDNTSGIAPAENANWAIYIQSSTDLAGIMAVDTGGVLGAAGQVVVSQELISAITNMVMKELVKKTHIVNNLLATDTSTVLAGPMGKQLAEKDAELQKQINDTNSNLGDFKTGLITTGHGIPAIKCIGGLTDGSYADIGAIANGDVWFGKTFSNGGFARLQFLPTGNLVYFYKENAAATIKTTVICTKPI